MTMHQPIPLRAAIRNWINDGSIPPDWIWPQMIGPQAANGTFLIDSPLGSARVHVGHVVVGHESGIWCREPAELAELIEGLEAGSTATNVTAIGPGKSAQFGCKRKTSGRTARRPSYRPPAGTMPSIEWVHTAELSVDHKYQRSTDNQASQRLIATIAANFDWRLCATLMVSRRPDGSKLIIDGQHRWSAAIRRGDLPQLPCCLFTYDSPEEEARMFIVANRARKPMNRLDDFHAALAAADDDAIEIATLVSDAGLKITRQTSSAAWKPGEIAFTASIANMLRKHGAAVVSAALTNIAEAFPNQKVTHSGSIFLGMVKILAHQPVGFDPDRLFRALQKYDAAGWGAFVQGLKGGDTRACAIRDALLMAYDETPAEADFDQAA